MMPGKRGAEMKFKSGKTKKIFSSGSVDNYDSGSSLSELDLRMYTYKYKLDTSF